MILLFLVLFSIFFVSIKGVWVMSCGWAVELEWSVDDGGFCSVQANGLLIWSSIVSWMIS